MRVYSILDLFFYLDNNILRKCGYEKKLSLVKLFKFSDIFYLLLNRYSCEIESVHTNVPAITFT